jgi:hypothetical protein
MKTRLLNYKYLLALFALAVSSNLSGQTYENSRSLREGYRVGPNVEVQVVNKYGDIHLVPWQKDSVVFEISLVVTSTKQAKVDKIFDYIDFEFKETTYYVIAQTTFENQNNFWSEMADVASTIFSSGTNTRIDYTVYFPAGNDVRIENKFGNIYTSDHTGKVDINLSNGDMKGHAFTGPARIAIEFGNASIDEISNGTVSLGYAELTLEKAGEINFETRASKLYLNNCNTLHLDSKRDRYTIKSVGEITGETYFSYLSIDKVTSKINLKTNYGDIKLMDFGDRFQRIDLNTQNTDITMYLDNDHFYEFDILRDERSSVISSAGVISKKEEPLPDDPKSFKAYVTMGKQGKQKIPVSINIKSGKLYLMGT